MGSTMKNNTSIFKKNTDKPLQKHSKTLIFVLWLLPVRGVKVREFKIADQFYLDDQPFKILSGAIHYFRVHPDD